MSSHRTEEVKALAHHIVVLDEGRVVESGPPETLEWARTQSSTPFPRLQVIQ
jgi:ABC-type multidrug transport system ATPase subunit